MNLQEIYDDLDNIISTLNLLINEIGQKDYIEELELIKYKAMAEKEDVEVELQKEYDREEEEMNEQFINERI